MEEIPQQLKTKVKRVVLFGPESTGKTTLARALAQWFRVPWVPEYARAYLQEKWELQQEVCQPKDLIPIAIGQMKIENEAVVQAEERGDTFIVCDTDLLETLVYSEVYYDQWVDSKLSEAVRNQDYDLYLLTGIDVPWVADDLRDKPNDREEMYAAFEEALIRHRKNFIPLSGNQELRLNLAIKAIQQLIHS